jgi:hypothetical protein
MGLRPVELVERAVLCPPRGIRMIGAHGSDAPYQPNGPRGRCYRHNPPNVR